jgi:L-2-hydroxyglutarate oxidase LhgO
MTKHYDIAIVGGGIIGLTVAREIRRRKPSARIAVLEKEPEPGRHASGRNSGVLHSGIYYGSDTFKAKVCSSGSKAMQEYAAEHGIAMAKTGKVIVATRPETASQIDVLQRRAEANGIRVRRLDASALKEIEPHARTFGNALHSPDTAVIDVKAVMETLRGDLLSSGIDLIVNAQVTDVDPKAKSLSTNNATYEYGHLINCAGAHADRIAHLFGVGRQYAIVPFRGSYYRLSDEKNGWVRGSIYPVPDLRYPFLGVHLTRGISGAVYLGPTATPALGRENYHGLEGIDIRESPVILGRLVRMYYHNEDNFRALFHSEFAKYRKERFLHELQAMVPGLEERDLVACDKVGIRPQLVNTASWKLEMDFVIESGPDSTHVLNAISPAFTGAFEFAKVVAERVT